MESNEYQYLLTYNSDPIEVETPDGWDNIKIDFDRSKLLKGFVRSFSADALFIGSGRDFIKSIYDNYGFDEIIDIAILKRNHDTWAFEPFLVGILELKDYEDKETGENAKKVKVSMSEASAPSQFMARLDNEINIESTESINGVALNGLDAVISFVDRQFFDLFGEATGENLINNNYAAPTNVAGSTNIIDYTKTFDSIGLGYLATTKKIYENLDNDEVIIKITNKSVFNLQAVFLAYAAAGEYNMGDVIIRVNHKNAGDELINTYLHSQTWDYGLVLAPQNSFIMTLDETKYNYISVLQLEYLEVEIIVRLTKYDTVLGMKLLGDLISSYNSEIEVIKYENNELRDFVDYAYGTFEAPYGSVALYPFYSSGSIPFVNYVLPSNLIPMTNIDSRDFAVNEINPTNIILFKAAEPGTVIVEIDFEASCYFQRVGGGPLLAQKAGAVNLNVGIYKNGVLVKDCHIPADLWWGGSGENIRRVFGKTGITVEIDTVLNDEISLKLSVIAYNMVFDNSVLNFVLVNAVEYLSQVGLSENYIRGTYRIHRLKQTAGTGVLVRTWLPHELLSKAIEITTDESNILESDILGRTDIGYVADGELALTGVTVGHYIRGGEPSLKPMVTKISDIFKSLNAIKPIGLLWDYVNSKFKVVPESELWQDVQILEITDYQNLKISAGLDWAYNEVKGGYDSSFAREEDGTTEESNVPVSFNLQTKRVKGIYNIRAPFRADPVAIESLARVQLSEYPTLNKNEDNEIFMLDLKRDGTYDFKTRQKADLFTEVSGISGAETRINMWISPARNIIRHLPIIAASAWKKTGQQLKFAFTQFFSSLSTKTADETVAVVETANININQTPYYVPEKIEFDSPLTDAMLLAILANPYGYIKIGDYEAFLISMKSNQYKRTAQFECLRRYSLALPPISQDPILMFFDDFTSLSEVIPIFPDYPNAETTHLMSTKLWMDQWSYYNWVSEDGLFKGSPDAYIVANPTKNRFSYFFLALKLDLIEGVKYRVEIEMLSGAVTFVYPISGGSIAGEDITLTNFAFEWTSEVTIEASKIENAFRGIYIATKLNTLLSEKYVEFKSIKIFILPS